MDRRLHFQFGLKGMLLKLPTIIAVLVWLASLPLPAVKFAGTKVYTGFECLAFSTGLGIAPFVVENPGTSRVLLSQFALLLHITFLLTIFGARTLSGKFGNWVSYSFGCILLFGFICFNQSGTIEQRFVGFRLWTMSFMLAAIGLFLDSVGSKNRPNHNASKTDGDSIGGV